MIFDSFIKGENGEKEVFKKIKKFLDKKSENYYLLQHVALKDITTSDDIDILLVHPILGIYIIEVKNWSSLDNLRLKNPYSQANKYQDILMSLISKKIGNVINVEYRVVFPSIRKKDGLIFLENSGFGGYTNNTLFKEDLENLEGLFKSTNTKIPTKEEFLKITSLLIPLNKQKNIKPIITRDEVLFYDQKQLSVLNGYTGGLKVVRGVAGTGKSLILINFVKNMIKNNHNLKFLVICYNKKLKNHLETELNNQNIQTETVFSLLNKVGFVFEGKKIGKCLKCGNDLVVRKGKTEFIGCSNFPKCKYTEKLTLPKKYKILEEKESLDEFKKKFSKFQNQNNFNYFLADETQDLPAGIVRIIINEIEDSILFIDEAQKIFSYTMDSIKEVLWHKQLGNYKNISVNNFRNLYNVYRTPSNISKCAFEILSLDKNIDKYYRKIRFINNDFLKDIKFILEEGVFLVDNFNEIEKLKVLNDKVEGNKIILSFKKDDVEQIEKKIKDIEVMPISAVKGLEAENIIIHNFEEFLNVASQNKEFFRQVYVLLTRTKKNIYISINKEELKNNEKIDLVIDILNKYSNTTIDTVIKSFKEPVVIDDETKEKIRKGASILIRGVEILSAFMGLV